MKISNVIIEGKQFIPELNDTQKEMQEVARKFAREEIAPAAAHHDETGEWPEEIHKKAWSLGLTNKSIPEHCGKYPFKRS